MSDVAEVAGHDADGANAWQELNEFTIHLLADLDRPRAGR